MWRRTDEHHGLQTKREPRNRIVQAMPEQETRQTDTHTHTHTYVCAYIYIYIHTHTQCCFIVGPGLSWPPTCTCLWCRPGLYGSHRLPARDSLSSKLNRSGYWRPDSSFVQLCAQVSVLVSLLALGEGWHDYHHLFPWDYAAADA